MNIAYCLPIIKSKKEKILETINNEISNYQYFEVWLDYIEDIDLKFIDLLVKKLDGRLILLFRRKNLDKIKMAFNRRTQIISLLTNSSSMLDLDFTTQKKELDYIADNNLAVKKIISYHSYKKTPTNLNLKRLIKKISNYQPTIYKVVTFCNIQLDALRLLMLAEQLKQEKLRFIVLGMGSFGTITRVFGRVAGNEMIFAPKNKNELSAPGQLTKKQLDDIFNALGVKNGR